MMINNSASSTQRYIALFLRLALAFSFLSAVADRFGIWGPPGTANVAWGTFKSYLEYTGLLLPYLPASLVSLCGWVATVLEVILALGLFFGFFIRFFALASGVLLLIFAVTMTYALGFEPAFTYSVWTSSAAAFLLATLER